MRPISPSSPFLSYYFPSSGVHVAFKSVPFLFGFDDLLKLYSEKNTKAKDDLLLPLLYSLHRLPFLPRDASAERGDATVSRPSVCPSVRDV